MPLRKLIWVVAAVIVIALAVAAQEKQEKVIKHVPVKPTSAASGSEMYHTYCKDGKGGGPAAEALKTPPTDLTMLAKNNGGKYPSMKVAAAIRGEATLPAHGSKDMPVWGKLFWSMSGGHEAEVQQRVANLNHYIESLQAK